MTKRAEASAAADGAYEAPDGQAYEVYGSVEEVAEVDGSMVEIDRAYDAPRRQSFLAPGERGNLVSDE